MPGGSYKTAKPLPVRSTAVIGGGTMGSGIAVCLLSAGLPVYLLERNEKVSPIKGNLSSCQGFTIRTVHVCRVIFYPSSIFAQTQLGMLYFVLSAILLMNDFLIVNSPSFREKQVRPNDVWTCVACSYFIYKKLT